MNARQSVVRLFTALLLGCMAHGACASSKTSKTPRRDFCRPACEQPNLSGASHDRFKHTRCLPCAE